MTRPPWTAVASVFAYLLVGAGCAVLAAEYTGSALDYWGVDYFAPPDIFYRFGFNTDNLGLLYVGDAALWWSAAALLINRGAEVLREQIDAKPRF